MIVASLLLILVAVTLLVLGLAGGSSSLLIGSIVASLLAAVALVIGARQASAARRAATAPGDLAADDLGRRSTPAARRADLAADGSFLEPAARRRDDLAADDIPVDDAAAAADEAFAEAYAAGRRDAEEHVTGPDVTQRVHPDAELYDDAADRTSSGRAAGPAAASRTDDPDYDQASSVIGGARAGAEDETAWRREPAPAPAQAPVPDVSPVAESEGLPDEFDEPDPDDPDDEPLPQAVRPADAVRAARLDAEVLVVDGRPRYHLAECPHLVGRLTEALPVAEAVELGFSPCGLCRPVDRLVAAAAQR